MNRFKIEPSTQQNGWWAVTDTENLIVVRFREHQFNETQQVTVLDESKFAPISAATATQVAHIMCEIADWLRANHYKKAMP